jgi:hypothetical protein
MDTNTTASIVFNVDGLIVRCDIAPHLTRYSVAARDSRDGGWGWRGAAHTLPLAYTLALFNEELAAELRDSLSRDRDDGSEEAGAKLAKLERELRRNRDWSPVPWSELETIDPQGADVLRGDYLSDIGRRGGSVKSAAKAAAVRENGKLGGRPRKDQ